MKMTKRKLLIWLGTILALATTIMALMLHWINRPLYTPGQLRNSGVELDPQSFESMEPFFHVESDIKLNVVDLRS